jgi:dimethylaniline monooxygenase (N-oxide forming)
MNKKTVAVIGKLLSQVYAISLQHRRILMLSFLLCLLGAGSSGLTTAKALLEAGLKPHIFEKSDQLGGIWASSPPFSWPSMRSNVPKYTCAFSDFPYSDLTTPSYPHASQLAEYLKAYAEKFLSSDHISLSHRVTSVSREREKGKWSVCWQEGLQKDFGNRLFDFVVIAAGNFAEPLIPDISGLNTFPEGGIIHSSQYQNPSVFQGSRVAVIGAGFSGAEIAADLAIHAEVFHVFPRPFYALPRHLPMAYPDRPPPFLPLQSVLHQRTNRLSLEEY